MEENLNNTSPLGAYPNENPSPTFSRKHWYTSKQILISFLACIIVGLGIFGGYLLLGKTDQKTAEKMVVKPTATPEIEKQTITKVTPAEITANWKTYTDDTYGYSIKYQPTSPTVLLNTSQYGYTDYVGGCVRVYAVPQSIIKTLTEEKDGIPWKQLSDLKEMSVGESRNCSVLTFTFGEDGKAIIDRNDYVRLPSQNIANTDWYTFSVKNGDSTGVEKHTVSFTEKNDTTYLIETKTGGQCPKSEATDMLSTFTFTK